MLKMPVLHRKFLQKLCFGIVALIAVLSVSPNLSAQRIALKTNALEYFVLSPNLGFEARLSRVLSLQLSVGCNPIRKDIVGCRFTNFRVEPELRYWFNRPMARHFIALSTTAAMYDLNLRSRILKGDAISAGISYGYALVLSRHWNMEAEIGVGVCHSRNYKYRDWESQPEKQNCIRTIPVPIRCGLSFCYIFK